MSLPLATEVKAVQVPSGEAVLPVRISRPIPVPGGAACVQARVPHDTLWPPSKMRELKAPEAEKGLIRIQSTTNLPPPTDKSLARGRIAVANEIVCVATTVPSMRNTTVEAFHSMRNR